VWGVNKKETNVGKNKGRFRIWKTCIDRKVQNGKRPSRKAV